MAIEVVSHITKNFKDVKKSDSLVGTKFSSFSKLVLMMPKGTHATVRMLNGTWAGWYHTVEKTGELTYYKSRRPQMEY